MSVKIEEGKGEHNVFLAFIQDWTRERADELRDHIAESLPIGCAILPKEIDGQVISLPDLGGVKIWCGVDLSPEPDVLVQKAGLDICEKDGLTYVDAAKDEKQAVDSEKSTACKIAEEKRAILARLKTWREAHGPGCLNVLAKKVGHGITAEMLRDLCLGAVKLLIDDWRRINKALDKLEEEERKAAHKP